MLAEAEEKWAPADDPIFDLVPPPFQELVDQCYDELGRPVVTFESFWEVYRDLRDEVDTTIPLNVVTSLNQSASSDPGEDEGIEFTLAHLRAPELNMRNAVDANEEEVEDFVSPVSFTVDNDQDQLY